MNRKKGSFALESLRESDQKYITTDFGTKVELNEKIEEVITEAEAEAEEKDVLVSIIGNFGKYQLLNCLLMGFTGITFSWMNFGTKFLTEDTEYWCSRPNDLSNLTSSEWLNISAPYLTDPVEFDRCRIFDVAYSAGGNLTRPPENTPTKACSSWEFSHEDFENTAIERWSMVCDRDFQFKTICQSVFFVGHFVGALIAGVLADWFGRKRAFILILVPAIGIYLASYFVDNPYAWIVLRFFVGVANMAATTVKSVYAVEWTAGKWRSYAQHFFVEPFFCFAQISMGLLVFLIPDMKLLELVMALGLVPFLAFIVILPESPRWLISKGRVDEAKVILTKALKMNKQPLSRLDELDKIARVDKDSPQKQAFFTDLLKYPGIRRNILLMSFCWFAFSMGYYGLIYNTPSFGWNIYITFCMPAFFSLPVNLTQPYFQNKFGRKPILTFLMFLSGVSLLCTLTIPDDMFKHNWPVMVFAWVGTVACNTAFGVGYVFTKELFPTTHRTLALSVASACARVGAIASPYVALLEKFGSIYSLVVYGGFVLIGGLLSIWIWPDTRKTKIPDTMDECEKTSSSKNTWLFCYKV